MAYRITEDCIGCGACQAECPEGAISEDGDRFRIEPGTCSECSTCADVCPVGVCVPG